MSKPILEWNWLYEVESFNKKNVTSESITLHYTCICDISCWLFYFCFIRRSSSYLKNIKAKEEWKCINSHGEATTTANFILSFVHIEFICAFERASLLFLGDAQCLFSIVISSSSLSSARRFFSLPIDRDRLLQISEMTLMQLKNT